MAFSRANPSPRYLELVALYRQMHREGIPQLSVEPEQLYIGHSLIGHLPAIRKLIHATGARSLLDYGSGKALVYRSRNLPLKNGEVIPSIQTYLGVDRISWYDPGVPEFSRFPGEKFDGVICTDVLEHCPEEDIPWILAEIFAAAERFVYANIASYPAVKSLPNGENAHCTQRPAKWWRALVEKVAAQHPRVIYEIKVKEAAQKNRLARMLFGRGRGVTLSNMETDG